MQIWGDSRYSRVVVDIRKSDAGVIGVTGETRLYIDDIVFTNGDFLEFFWRGAVGYNIFLKKRGQETLDIMKRIRFRSANGALLEADISYEGPEYYSVLPGRMPWTRPPVPEPTTYGAVFAACGLGFALYRGRKRTGRQREARP